MPSKPAKPVARQRKPKAEVFQEFESIQSEVEASHQSADAKTAQAAAVREAEVRQAVDGVSVEGVVEHISALGLEVSRALAGISSKLVDEVERLATVREAIASEKREIERLHKIDVAATALDQMVHDYALERERLAAEITAQRAAWEEEARVAERERREQEEALKKQRQREIEDYEYKKAIERKKTQDKYDEEQRVLERKNAEKQEQLDKTWHQREAALRQTEQETESLRQQVAQFPDRLKAEVDRAAADAVRTAQATSQQEMVLLKKDSDTEKRVSEMRVKTLEELVARQSSQIEALEKQLTEAKQQVQDIAVKAIEGASGSRTLSHINQIAMEQAKNRPRSE